MNESAAQKPRLAWSDIFPTLAPGNHLSPVVRGGLEALNISSPNEIPPPEELESRVLQALQSYTGKVERYGIIIVSIALLAIRVPGSEPICSMLDLLAMSVMDDA